MTTILVLIAVLWTGTVWAETCLSGSIAPVDCHTVCENGRWVRLRSACEERMEAAMRAVDPYVPTPSNRWIFPNGDLLGPGVHDRCTNDRVCMAERDLAEAKAKEQAAKQWDTVKKECWLRQP